jgi:hypothetical protein
MYMKVKDLKKALENVPDDAEVRYQRIEDIYFETHGWSDSKVMAKKRKECDDVQASKNVGWENI